MANPLDYVTLDYILIEGLKVTASVGVHAWEKVLRQPLLIDLKLGCQLDAPGRSDNLSDTLDYAQITQFVQDRTQGGQFNLLETLANQIADDILQNFGQGPCHIESVQISLKKVRIIPGTQHVGVQVTRHRPRS